MECPVKRWQVQQGVTQVTTTTTKKKINLEICLTTICLKNMNVAFNIDGDNIFEEVADNANKLGNLGSDTKN